VPPRRRTWVTELKTRRLAVLAALVVVFVGLSYLLLSGPPASEAATTTAKGMVSVLAFNSSQQILYDYAGRMDLSAVEAVMDGHPASLIPEQEIMPHLPGPLPVWGYVLFGDSYISNSTDSTALGMYGRGSMFAFQEIAYVTISHRIGGFEFSWNPRSIEGVLSLDDGYPKDVKVQGYTAVEWRSTGENLGDTGDFEGHLDSIGGLWVQVGGPAVIPEAGFLVVMPFLLALGGQF
jgi:hypothetical protein